ncbi:MAG TPA: DUF2723 domain-containing protein, partial [Longimicrobiales bacterium]|nr:DUF2723 domain-containing protein [Longimicrobiales bacterium]
TTAYWDTSEYIATAHILGIPHPPGNPLFVVLARSWDVLLAPLDLPVAVRINLLSASMAAAAHALWFLVVHQILRRFPGGRGFRLTGAAVAVLVSATAFTVWNQSNVNEKVYTVSLLTIALLTWLAFRWRERSPERRGDRLLVLMVFVLALSVGNHLMAFLAAPAILLFVLMVRPGTFARWRLYPWVVGAALVGLTIHLFLPLRAALDPVINQGAPLCDSIGSALGAILTWGRAGCEALGSSLLREQYQKPPVWAREAPLGPQLLNYLQYFDWQWSRSVQGGRVLLADLRIPFTMLFTGLGVWGALTHRRRDRTSFWYLLTLFGTLSLGLVVYMNFQYGYSIPDPFGNVDLHEVRERDYFFIASFSVWGLWAGIGIATLWRRLSDRVVGGPLRASPVLAVALLPLVLNGPWADRSADRSARDWAYNLLMSVEPYGVLFTHGDNDTFPLWYLQEVEGVRRDVTVVVTSYLNVPWYARQLRDLTRPCDEGDAPLDDVTRIVCQRPYQPGPRVAYTSRPDTVAPGTVSLPLPEPVRRPARPIMELDDATIDRVGRSFVPLEEPRRVRVGPLEPVLPGGRYLYPWHQYALAIVDTAFADGRPVYWASSGSDALDLGLEPYLVRQGLAYKVSDEVARGDPGEDVVRLPDEVVPMGMGRWVDVPRTRRLLERVFVHREGLPAWDHWPDHSTTGIPLYYAWGYDSLAMAAYLEGEERDTLRYRRLADQWRRLAQ